MGRTLRHLVGLAGAQDPLRLEKLRQGREPGCARLPFLPHRSRGFLLGHEPLFNQYLHQDLDPGRLAPGALRRRRLAVGAGDGRKENENQGKQEKTRLLAFFPCVSGQIVSSHSFSRVSFPHREVIL